MPTFRALPRNSCALAAEAARRSEAGATNLPTALLADETVPPPPQSDDLESMLIEDWAGHVAGSTYLEENLRIARSTLHRWQRRGDVIALRKGGRKHVFPWRSSSTAGRWQASATCCR